MVCPKYSEIPVFDSKSGKEDVIFVCMNGGELIPEYCPGDYKYCPRMGGDDRLRKSDALTEQMRSVISDVVRLAVLNLNSQVLNVFQEVAKIIGETGYEPLKQAFSDTVNEGAVIPVVPDYTSIAPSPMEKRCASGLEENLNGILCGFLRISPPYIKDTGQLNISSHDFDAINEIILDESASLHVGGLGYDGISAGSLGGFYQPTSRLLCDMESSAYGYIKGLEDSFLSVKYDFENGVSGAAKIDSGRGYDGRLPEWF